MKLDELLDFLGQANAVQEVPAAAAPTSPSRNPRTSQELRGTEQQVEKLQAQIDSLRTEQELCERRAKDCQAAGDKNGELEALRRALQVRDAQKRARDELMRCYDRMDYLRQQQ